MKFTFTISDLPQSLTIKKYLMQQGISKHLWRQLKQRNAIRLNGIPVNATLTYASSGDTIECELLETSSILPRQIPLNIVFEDEHLLVINKQAGLLVHPVVQEQNDTIANAVHFYYQQTHQTCIFHPLHRLDRNTTGLLFIAKTPYIQHIITKKAPFHRTYLAITEKPFTTMTGEITLPIARKPGSNILREINPSGQAARSNYEVLAQTQELALVRLAPLTGRTHQLRVHLASIDHPIIGDDLYGSTNNLMAHQALHSFNCNFVHPVTHQTINLTATLPADMKNVLTKKFPPAVAELFC